MRISKKQSCKNASSQIIVSEYSPCGRIGARIIQVRGKYVMVDRDLAELYKVPTKALNQAVKRNSERFPERFRFALTPLEKEEVVTNCDHLKSLRFSHVPIYAFTEQGEVAKFNRKYKGLAVTCSDDFHDRFLIIDNEELHGPGSSINSLGRRITSYSTRDPKDIAKLPALVP